MKKMMSLNAKSGPREIINKIDDSEFRFYEIMEYPIPIDRNRFSYKKRREGCYKCIDGGFSRKNETRLMKQYIGFINSWGRLYKNMPFIKNIYLGNSISFNALNQDSDIDIFVITKKGRIRIARLFISLFMILLGIKRTRSVSKKKFCLSFFIDEEHMNLKNIQLGDKDIYLPYWIAHLIPIYQEQDDVPFYQANNWIKAYLPNIQLRQNIYIGCKKYRGNGWLKNIIQKLLLGSFGDRVENLIRKIWIYRMKKIIKNNPVTHHDIIIEEGILKFYDDKRKGYSKLFFGNDN